MSILTAADLTKSFGAQDVFVGVDVSVAHGEKIALVGANGMGKTTLLRILLGLEEPSGGHVARMKDLRMGYLPQQAALSGKETPWQVCCAVFGDLQAMQRRLRALEAELADPDQGPELLERYGRLQHAFEHAGGYDYEVEVAIVLGGLGIDEVHMHRPLDRLSGGQQTRVLLARLLLQRPQVLVLDEPTNHLDLDAIEWLESYLQSWPEALIVVSHDRRFLDKVVDRIWDLSFGRLEVYRGRYSHYVQQRLERLNRRQSEWQEQQELIARTQDFIRRYKAGQRTREAQGRERRLKRLERLERPPETRTLDLRLESRSRGGERVLRTSGLVIGYDRPLLQVPDLDLHRLQRAALIGPNGAGKTTLLKTLLGQLPPLAGKVRLGASLEIGYWAQTREDLEPENTVLDEVLEVRDLLAGEVRSLMARFLFNGEDVFKRIADLSGGEQCRVALAKLTLAEPNFLVLDEPTNQLDIPSQEIVEGVLREFIGTILFVSHDRYLIDALATQVWAIEAGRLRVCEGNYQAYLAQKQAEAAAARELAEARKRAESERRRRQEAARAAAARDTRAIEQVEAEITDLEGALRRLEEGMAQASVEGDLDRVRAFDVEYHAIQRDLERLIAEWTALGEAGE